MSLRLNQNQKETTKNLLRKKIHGVEIVPVQKQ